MARVIGKLPVWKADVVLGVVALAGALSGVLSGAIGCAPRVAIEPSTPLPKPECVAPDVVDGQPVTPIALGDSISGQDDSAPTLAFCTKPDTWVRFTFDQSQGAQQPMLFLKRGSETLAENRFFGLDADRSTQLFVGDDAIYTLALTPLSATHGTQFSLTVARPGADVVIVKDGAASIAYGQEAWGTFASDDDTHTIALPAAPQPSLLTVRAALSGFYGNGATTTPVVDVVEGAGSAQTVIAELDFTDKTELQMPLDANEQPALRVRGAGVVGERPFYALEQVALDANPPVTIAAGPSTRIDSIERAQPLSLATNHHDYTHRIATAVVELAPGDDDFFAFSANEGDTVHFSCAAESAGSGLRALEVDLRDAAGTLILRTHEEKHDHDVIGGTRTWMDPADSFLPNATAGTYYGEVRAGSFDDVVTSRYAICTATAGVR